MYTLLNRLDSADYYLQLERKYNPRWDNTEEYHWAQSTLLIKKHDYENAVAELEKMWTIHDKGIKEVLKTMWPLPQATSITISRSPNMKKPTDTMPLHCCLLR